MFYFTKKKKKKEGQSGLPNETIKKKKKKEQDTFTDKGAHAPSSQTPSLYSNKTNTPQASSVPK